MKISNEAGRSLKQQSLPMQGARIEKSSSGQVATPSQCRSPYGERELKIQGLMMLKEQIMSLPTQGARIEIIAVSSGNTAQIAPHAGSEN